MTSLDEHNQPGSTAERPPNGARARTLHLDGREYLLLSFTIEPAVHSTMLTPAERAVARSIVAGASNAQIARDRRRSVRTIANQTASVFKKLNVSSRLELAYALARVTHSPTSIPTTHQ